MVHRARNTYCDIHIGVYRFARKPHLQFIRQIITTHYLSRCGYTRVYFFGELLYFRYSLPRAVAYAYNNFFCSSSAVRTVAIDGFVSHLIFAIILPEHAGRYI